ncbi:hypothetical protein COL154_014217, partial [Colletotrichum chrysophilum]
MGLNRPTGDELARAIAERTGHAFTDLRLLETALTHSSAVKAVANNERLEFLGDRVLGLVVADMLFRQFPHAAEGEIAPRFNALVDARTCSQVGVELELDRFVRADAALKARTRGSGGNYLADAVEARIDEVDPAELSPGEFAQRVRDRIERDGVKVLVIDSLNGYLHAMPQEQALILQMHELLTYLNQKNVATFLITNQHGLVGQMQTTLDISYLSDAVLLLRYFEVDGQVRKALS